MIKNEKLKRMLFIAMITAVMGQVYIKPFSSSFRISLGVVALSILLVTFEDLPIILTNIITAMVILVFRCSLDTLGGMGPLNEVVQTHLPAVFYYILFGILFQNLKMRSAKDNPLYFIFLLGIIDMSANLFEALLRNEFYTTSIDVIISRLAATGFSRALISFILFSAIRFYNVLLLREESRKRFNDGVMLASKMNAEVFILKKNMGDIENAMERSYTIYDELKNERLVFDEVYRSSLMDKMLELSKDIHELRKDNNRIVAGIESIIPKGEEKNSMKLSEVMDIISESAKSVVKSRDKDIELFIDLSYDFDVLDYYSFISIINNLISNSTDAILSEGFINISQRMLKDHVVIEVLDNGSGIKDRDLLSIFEPGFSTKFDKATGEMSTGIGLSHVKNIVEMFYKGTIVVSSDKISGTKFIITIPKEKIIDMGGAYGI